MPEQETDTLDPREISQRVDILESQLNGTNVSSSVLGDIIAQLENLERQAQISPTASMELSEKIHGIEEEAQQKKKEEEEKEARETAEMIAAVTSLGGTMMAASAAEMAFSQTMLSYMTQNERQFFNSLEGPQQLVMLDANGQVITNPNGTARIEIIDGSKLQADFSLLVYNTKDKAEQEKIGELPAEMQGVDKVHDALTRMEGHHLHRQMKAGLSLEEARKECRGDFARAHDQVNSTFAVEATAHALEEAAKKNPVLAMNAKVAGLAAKYHRDKLGQDLTEVIDDLAPDGQQANREYAQGADVSSPSAPLAIGLKTNSLETSRQ